MVNKMTAKIIKVELIDYKEGIILYENQKIRTEPFNSITPLWTSDKPEDKINEAQELSLKITIDKKGSIFEREYSRHGNHIYLKLPKRSRKLIEVRKTDFRDEAVFEIQGEEWYMPLIQLIKKIEKNFCMTEDELVDSAHNFIKKKYNTVNFQVQKEIGGCIIDGLAFAGSESYKKAKIIGFEVKTNKDNYKRLYNQISAYLMICDEVYLVIEDKEIPADLPFFVGVLRIQDGKTLVEREPICLKHEIDESECWQFVVNQIKYDTSDGQKNLDDFFKAIDSFKRKLIWNQFVKGFNKMFIKEEDQISEQEKDLVEAFFKSKKVEKKSRRKIK